MQVVPLKPETAAWGPRPVSLVKATASTVEATEALATPPSWAALPPARRRRLVAVLGAIVQRMRKESLNEP
jgi:hypothetical protein